ncbi:MAG: D-alanine transaminase [Gammaproteobacteria bacterium]|jgi:D-alanine transaminase
MTRNVYLNGEYLPESEAKISIFDRSVLFGDAIYEVAGVSDGKLINFDSHIERYLTSLEKLEIPVPLTRAEVLAAFRELIKLNNLVEGLVYMHVSRGVADRDFTWQKDLIPTVFMFTQIKPSELSELSEKGIKLKSHPDLRWARRDIKSANLLGQVLAKKVAKDAGANEALLIDDEGYVTECGSSSFFIVKDNEILTHPLTQDVLAGRTRQAMIELCAANDIVLVETRFTLQDALNADEAMNSAALAHMLPVIEIDGHPIGKGTPGPVYRKLRSIYLALIEDNLI